MLGVRRGSVPSDFDPEAYLALNPDVRAANVDPRKHYRRHGHRENRPYTRGTDGVPVRERPDEPTVEYSRAQCLTGLDLAHGRGLEIGPLDRPVVPPGTGPIHYADHLSTEALREKYAVDPAVRLEDLATVDFDLSTMSLRDTAADGPFDYVVASHVVEHVPDLLGWLRDVEAILTDGGTLALVVPDKRFTFDLFRRLTTPWMVDEAVGRERPDLDIVLEYLVNVVAVDSGGLWAGTGEDVAARRIHSPQTVLDVAARHAAGEYVDVHCWVFTPTSFVDLVADLAERHGLGFRVALFQTTVAPHLEFVVQLQKTPAGERASV